MNHQSPHYLTTGGNNPFYPHLVQAIENANQILVAVAFIRQSGVNLIFDVLQDALLRGKEVRILTGDYLGLTEPRALRQLLQLTQTSDETNPEYQNHCELRVFESKNLSFHPKAYLFITLGDHKTDVENGFAYIGSSNLSASALKEGVEWNIRVDLHENPGRFIQLINAYQELFQSEKTQPLTHSWIDAYQARRQKTPTPQMEIETEQEELTPRSHQMEALEALKKARQEGCKKGVVVMATGLGKTYLSAFDSLQVTSKTAPKILFVAHRQEILNQAELAYLDIYPEASTGYFMGSQRDYNAEILFASINTLGKSEYINTFAPEHFDYIVIDEFHHAAAKSYTHLLRHFKPKFLLGLTATPQRTDGTDIYGLCDGNKLYEMNLLEGIRIQKLAPFQYFGIQDEFVDYQRISWRQGKFVESDLESSVNTKQRAAHIFKHWQEKSLHRTLAFCVSISHAEYMADYFRSQGISCTAVHSQSTVDRHQAIHGLTSGQYQVLFTVDLFNEGIDIPLIDTVLMLRPTESKIIFLQQLGRGLRTTDLIPDKQLQVLDFIGNHHVFLNRPQVLLGLENHTYQVQEFIRQYHSNQVPLPTGCSMNYELEVIDWIQEWSEKTQRKNINNSSSPIEIQTSYQWLKENLGSRPSALEMSQTEHAFKNIRKKWGSWFELVQENQDLSEIEIKTLHNHIEFFRHLEKSQITKSYKMVTLQAVIELNGLMTPQTILDVAKQSFEVLSRRKRLRGDLLGVNEIEGINEYFNYKNIPRKLQKKWLSYWKKNPINAWCNHPFFEVLDGKFVFKEPIEPSLIETFHDMVQELVDFRLYLYEPKLKS